MRKQHLAALLVWLAAAQAMIAMFGQRVALVSAMYWCVVTAYWCRNISNNSPAADVAEGYSVGDICFYCFGSENKSLALVEIVKILDDERGVAELKFLKVFVDDTGNGLFYYLLRSGKTMNGSFKYLVNITPNCGGKDG